MDDLHCTCYRLRKAARQISQIYDHHLAAFELTANQLGIIAMVARNEPVAMGKLSTDLGMDASTLTRNMRPLIERGIVELIEGRDRRQRQVRLTAAGWGRAKAALPAWQHAERAVMLALGQSELARLHALLSRLGAQAEDAGGYAASSAAGLSGS